MTVHRSSLFSVFLFVIRINSIRNTAPVIPRKKAINAEGSGIILRKIPIVPNASIEVTSIARDFEEFLFVMFRILPTICYLVVCIPFYSKHCQKLLYNRCASISDLFRKSIKSTAAVISFYVFKVLIKDSLFFSELQYCFVDYDSPFY